MLILLSGGVKTQDRIQHTAPSPASSSSGTKPVEAVKQPQPTPQAVERVFPLDLKQVAQDFEVDLIKQALADSQFNQKKTAEKLCLTYHQLRGYLKKYNLLESAGDEQE